MMKELARVNPLEITSLVAKARAQSSGYGRRLASR
jgi:hypothetical protein